MEHGARAGRIARITVVCSSKAREREGEPTVKMIEIVSRESRERRRCRPPCRHNLTICLSAHPINPQSSTSVKLEVGHLVCQKINEDCRKTFSEIFI